LRTFRLAVADATHIQPDDPDDVREIVESRFMFRPSLIDVGEPDYENWLDFVVHFSFEANSLAELRSEVDRIMRTCGRDVEVFSVMDDLDNVLFTEEDF